MGEDDEEGLEAGQWMAEVESVFVSSDLPKKKHRRGTLLFAGDDQLKVFLGSHLDAIVEVHGVGLESFVPFWGEVVEDEKPFHVSRGTPCSKSIAVLGRLSPVKSSPCQTHPLAAALCVRPICPLTSVCRTAAVAAFVVAVSLSIVAAPSLSSRRVGRGTITVSDRGAWPKTLWPYRTRPNSFRGGRGSNFGGQVVSSIPPSKRVNCVLSKLPTTLPIACTGSVTVCAQGS
mmetsp:Transcript_48998/g.115030  ORF Transcript_48998/g.115030 Transcript_48998/m.115030 type:complete len:231 (+) Transcript_48998:249-941(+)